MPRASRLSVSVPGECRSDPLRSDGRKGKQAFEQKIAECCHSHSLVSSPLWTAHPEKMEQFSYNESFAITAETAAEAMATMVESQEYPGGSVVKVTLAGMERIQFDDLIQASSMDAEHARKFLHESNRPVQEKLALERGTNPLKAR